MSRGGRFGGGAARSGGLNLPDFDIDPALEADVVDNDNDHKPVGDKSRHYPPFKVPQAPPLTEREKREVTIWRQQLAKRRRGPYFLDNLDLGKDDPANFNAFEHVNTYANTQKNKKRKKNGGLPDVRKLGINWEFMPKELQYLQYGSSEDEGKKKRKKTDLVKKAKDRIDKIKENDEGEDETEKRKVDDEDDEEKEDDDEDDDDASLRDNDFSEDEDDAAGDYNAEQFFDNGEDDDDPDEGGGEDAW